MNSKEFAISKIEESSSVFTDLSDRIWTYAELSLKEYKSTADYIETLRKLGFEVEEKICGLDTAFSGKFGTGRPLIAILGEFDALSGLSQEAGSSERMPLCSPKLLPWPSMSPEGVPGALGLSGRLNKISKWG